MFGSEILTEAMLEVDEDARCGEYFQAVAVQKKTAARQAADPDERSRFGEADRSGIFTSGNTKSISDLTLRPQTDKYLHK